MHWSVRKLPIAPEIDIRARKYRTRENKVMIKKSKRPVSSSIYGAAAIQAVVGIMYWFIYSPLFTSIDYLFAFGFIIFLILGKIADRAPKPASVTAATLYGFYLFNQLNVSLKLFMTGLIFKIPITILLIRAIVFAFKSKPQGEDDIPAGRMQ